MDLLEKTRELHQKFPGKIGTQVLTPINDKNDLSLAYTPGVGEISKLIAANRNDVNKYTSRGRTVAVVTDGSAVLGLGNVGPEAALPVMEGKAALFKTFAGLEAVPLCLNTQSVPEIITIVKNLVPTFGGINLEDIAAPRCFAIEEALQNLGIPVMHDDQHGTAVVVLAGLINAAKVTGKHVHELKVVISGAGAAGQAIAKILVTEKVFDLLVLDTQGLIYEGRDDLDEYKTRLAQVTNRQKVKGDLKTALDGADVFIGVSKAGLLLPGHIKEMNEKPIIFALANPVPEIMPDEAHKDGAFVVATGRSDFPNQINNSLAFPGIFKGALMAGKKRITEEMKLAAAQAIAGMVKDPTIEKIVPGPFEEGLADKVAQAVAKA